MAKLHDLFDQTESYMLMQGVKMLHEEAYAQRSSVIKRIAPGDQIIPTILEGYDKRAAQLQALQSKLTALNNAS